MWCGIIRVFFWLGVIFWPYNWLGDLNDSVTKLENHINQQNYENVTFVTHSTGGLLASAYIARSNLNKERVDKAILIAAPLFGTYASIFPIERGDSKEGFELVDALSSNDWIRSWAHNSPTTYQLLPSTEYLQHHPLQHIKIGVANPNVSTASGFYSVLNGSGNMNNNLTNGTDRSHRYFRNTALKGDVVSVLQGVDTLLIGTKYGFSTPYTVVYNGNSVLTDILYSKDGDGTVHGCSAKGQKHGTISPLPFENFTKMDHGKLSNNKRVLTLVCNTISGAVGVPYMDSDEGEEEEEEEDASISDLIKIRYSGNAAVTATIYDAVGNVVATANNIEDDGFDGNDFIYDSFSEDENSTEGSIYMPNQGYKLVFSFGTNAGSFVDFTAEVSTLVDEGLKDTSVIHTANITTTGGTVATVDGTGQAIKNNTISTLIDGNVIIHP